MDYKYIEQLLDRYWECATTLEEEQILRTFFRQENVPVTLLPYKDLFTYQQIDVEESRLGEDFDQKMLELVGETAPVKAKTISITERLKPLFKAAAIVAIILTLGNAMQVAMQPEEPTDMADAKEYIDTKEGVQVAQVDTMHHDTLNMVAVPLLK
jgi:hypothetical protein